MNVRLKSLFLGSLLLSPGFLYPMQRQIVEFFTKHKKATLITASTVAIGSILYDLYRSGKMKEWRDMYDDPMFVYKTAGWVSIFASAHTVGKQILEQSPSTREFLIKNQSQLTSMLALAVVSYAIKSRIVTSKNLKEAEEKKKKAARFVGKIPEEVETLVELFKNPAPYQRLRAQLPRGILFHGTPGNGKTALARYIAYQTGAEFIETSSVQLMSMFLGASAKSVKALFAKARRYKKAIIFIDEIDSIALARSETMTSEHRAVLTTLLAEMDGFKQSENIIVIGATNDPESLDPAIKRAGRFDQIVTVSPPDEASRVKILELYFGDYVCEDAIKASLPELARDTAGWSGAELKTIANQSALFAAREKAEVIKAEHVKKAFAYCDTQRILRVADKDTRSVKKGEKVEFAGTRPAEIEEVLSFLKNPERFNKLGATMERGIILYGPPGNGKTLLARAIAQEADAAFFEFSAPALESKWVGESAKQVRKIFATARQAKSAIIFIDEIDAIGGHRGMGTHSVHAALLTAILTELDGFNSADNIIVIAATNRVDALDEALIRPGRFGTKILMPKPDEKAREAILRLYINKVACEATEKDAIVTRLVPATDGWSAAELHALVNKAALTAVRADAENVTNAHFADALAYCRLQRQVGTAGVAFGQPVSAETAQAADA